MLISEVVQTMPLLMIKLPAGEIAQGLTRSVVLSWLRIATCYGRWRPINDSLTVLQWITVKP